MPLDIETMLAYEVKKEIADRYFGFRKLIEENIEDYDNQIIVTFRKLEQKIGFDLVRLYILLKDEKVIHNFFQITGIEKRLFFDPYLAESLTIRKRVFADIKPHGLTRKLRFRNMVLETYQTLGEHIERYRSRVQKLNEEQQTIAEEIKIFYRNNDLSTIMTFLRGLGGSENYKAGAMEGGLTPYTGKELDKKMHFEAPPPVAELLPMLPASQPYKKIKKELFNVIDKAYILRGKPEMKEFTR